MSLHTTNSNMSTVSSIMLLQVLKMKATALVFEPGRNYMPTFGSFADVLHCGLPRNQNNYSDYRVITLNKQHSH